MESCHQGNRLDTQLSALPGWGDIGKGICEYPRNPLLPDQLLRGLLVALDQWVTSGVQPRLAGVRMPEIAVPTATYTGWNLRAAFAADLAHADGCDASGLKIDFPATLADRQATGDPRLSIKERYPTHQAYVNAVTAAANTLRDDRFLIQEDVDAYIDAAQASNIGN